MFTLRGVAVFALVRRFEPSRLIEVTENTVENGTAVAKGDRSVWRSVST